MTRPAFSPETREAMIGWRPLNGYQLPQDDGRKLKRCAQPSDPWCVALHNGPSILTATRIIYGIGATLDDAVRDALSNTAPSFREALTRLETAVDGLIGAYRAS